MKLSPETRRRIAMRNVARKKARSRYWIVCDHCHSEFYNPNERAETDWRWRPSEIGIQRWTSDGLKQICADCCRSLGHS